MTLTMEQVYTMLSLGDKLELIKLLREEGLINV